GLAEVDARLAVDGPRDRQLGEVRGGDGPPVRRRGVRRGLDVDGLGAAHDAGRAVGLRPGAAEVEGVPVVADAAGRVAVEVVDLPAVRDGDAQPPVLHDAGG